jgi:hypothetical protein
MTKKTQFCPRGHDTFQAGRDASKRCLQCKAEDAAAKAALREQALAEANAAFERRQEAAARRREHEYRAAIKRGGYDAAMARWDKAYGETNDAYGGRYGLCQWEDEVDGESLGRMCYRRTTDVYCHVHNRQLEREIERRRKAQESEDRAAVARTTYGAEGSKESDEAQPQRLASLQGPAPRPGTLLRLVHLAVYARASAEGLPDVRRLRPEGEPRRPCRRGRARWKPGRPVAVDVRQAPPREDRPGQP